MTADHQADIARGSFQQEQAVQEYLQVAAPLLSELAEAGLPVETISELYQKKFNYKNAVPILLKWIPHISNLYVLDDIVRALTDKRAKPIAAPVLIMLFKQVGNLTGSDIRWTIGNALSVVADDSVFDEVVELVTDQRYGRDREMLAVALGNMKNPKVVDVLISLLSDEQVAGHALIALGKLKAEQARPFIQSFLEHPKAWVRKEARRALNKLDRKRDMYS